MNDLAKILEQRRAETHGILERLLEAPSHPFDETLKKHLPNQHGLYLIAQNDAPSGEYLHAGKTRRGTKGLYGRIWDQHFNGGGKGAGSDLVQKIIDNGYATCRTDAQAWIKANCSVQFVIEEDEWRRGWAEHYILSIVRPIWGS